MDKKIIGLQLQGNTGDGMDEVKGVAIIYVSAIVWTARKMDISSMNGGLFGGQDPRSISESIKTEGKWRI